MNTASSMNIANFANFLPDQQKWVNLSDKQKLDVQKKWKLNNLKKTVQLVQDNIDSIVKAWLELELLSEKDVKFIAVTQNYNVIDEENKKYNIGVHTVLNFLDFAQEKLSDSDKDSLFASIYKTNKVGIPVLYNESNLYKNEIVSSVEFQVDPNKNVLYGLYDLPFDTLIFPYPQTLFNELVDEELAKQKTKKTKVKNEKLETEKEDELYGWLRLQGLDAHRQVKTSSGNKLDIWLPNQMIIEVKRSNVSGNDVCQAMEYVQSHCLPVVLVGDKISSSASRGLKAFNNLTHGNKIVFVTWDVIKDYLKGRFNK